MSGPDAEASQPSRFVLVWDRWVRVGHWLLVVAIAAAWFTREGRRTQHEYIGYVAAGVVAARIVWGFIGSPHALFSDFVHGPGATLRYARELAAGCAARFLGHNPLGGWMAIALLSLTAATAASGWLYTTDRYWGVEWVERLHATLTDVLLTFVALHVLGALVMSWHHGENLIAAMLHGRKRGREPAPANEV